MIHLNGFQQQKLRGKVVEEIVKRHLTNRGHLIEDVSEIRDYQKYDIDFLVTHGTTNELITLEVKRDDNITKTGNFFFEIGFQREDYYSMGWIDKSRADYLCFFDTKSSKGYILEFNTTKGLIAEIGKRHTFWDRIDQCEGIAYLVPIWKARKAGIIVYEWEETT